MDDYDIYLIKRLANGVNPTREYTTTCKVRCGGQIPPESEFIRNQDSYQSTLLESSASVESSSICSPQFLAP